MYPGVIRVVLILGMLRIQYVKSDILFSIFSEKFHIMTMQTGGICTRVYLGIELIQREQRKIDLLDPSYNDLLLNESRD